MSRVSWGLSLTLAAAAALFMAVPARADDDPLAHWRKGVTVHPVSTDENAHTIHSYFNTCPESPDGRFVLFFRSTTPEGEFGELRILERATGTERVIARNIHTEDAHRVAAQQWLSNGRRVSYQDERNGEWLTAVIDLETGQETVLAKGRLSGWGQPNADLLPLYGPHWDPGPHRDLEIANVATGEIHTVLTADEVTKAFPGWVEKQFSGKPISIFFPVLSPDLSRVFFKPAAPDGGTPRTTTASTREGLVIFDLGQHTFFPLQEHWGHPAWFPDNAHILDLPLGSAVIDIRSGRRDTIPEIPAFTSSHAAVSPDGKLFIADNNLRFFGGPPTTLGIIVGDVTGKSGVVWIDKFDNRGGAASWRVPHPHPVMSADGQRIYFNVNVGKWTRLFVAEAGR